MTEKGKEKVETSCENQSKEKMKKYPTTPSPSPEHHDSHREYIKGYQDWLVAGKSDEDEIAALWDEAGYGAEYRRLLEKGTPNEEYQHALPLDAIEESMLTELKCECGSDKVNLPYHSDWCPKFSRDL